MNFSREKFLLVLLGSVFAFQAALFSFGALQCIKLVDKDSAVTDICPELGRRYDQTFGVMIATVLALLSGRGTSSPS